MSNRVVVPQSLRTHNRALSKDRPEKAAECRRNIHKPNDCPCKLHGCDFVFLPFDRYGCCTRCGDEILT